MSADQTAVSWEACQRTHEAVRDRMDRQEKKLDRGFWLLVTTLLGIAATLASVLTAVGVQVWLAAVGV